MDEIDEQHTVLTGNGVVSGQWVPMASWGRRAAARLIDDAVYLVAYLPYFIGLGVLIDASPEFALFLTSGTPTAATPSAASPAPVDLGTLVLAGALMLLGTVLGLVAFIWNRVIQQGRTGQSVGKAALKLYLVSSTTGTPIGAGTSFLREIVHIVDGILYLGYLWPLWDRQKQTFADKIMGTVVAHAVPVAVAPEPVHIPWTDAPGPLPE